MPNVTLLQRHLRSARRPRPPLRLNSASPRHALGGWTLNAIFQLQSGMPVTVTQATNNNAFAGFALQRPNLVG